MSENITSKVNSLQKSFFELNNLFELNMIANQAFDIETFVLKLKAFIINNINIKNIHFFILRKNLFHPIVDKNSNDFDGSFVYNNNNEVLWEILQADNFIPVKNDKGEKLYKGFWEQNQLNFDCDYIKVFEKDKLPFCLAFIELFDDYKLNETDFLFLEKVFAFTNPLLIKFATKHEKDEELKFLYKSLHNISILYSISQAVNFIDDLKRLLKVILENALETLEAEKGSLMLYDYGENVLQVKVVYGLKDEKMQQDINNGIIECTKIPSGEGIAGKVFAQKQSIISNLGQNDPRFCKTNTNYNTTSIICVPLMVKNEAIGVINISNKKHKKLFNKQDLEFMEALANQAAIAIDNAKLYEMATKDGLTKLYIHRHFYTLLENEVKRAARYEHVLSLLMIDIDNFKQVNDTYGHTVGDTVLREIANVISQTVRTIDIPARYGGEEFAVILPETLGSDARIIAERLRVNISKICIPVKDGDVIRPTISLGISSFPSCSDDEQTLIELADVALYQSKNNGKNRTFEYTPMGCEEVPRMENFD